MTKFSVILVTFFVNVSLAQTPQVQILKYSYHGSFKIEAITTDNPNSSLIDQKLSQAYSSTILLDLSVKKIVVFAGEKPDSFKEKDQVSIHLDDPLWLWVELLSAKPKDEPYLAKIRTQQLPQVLIPYIGEENFESVMENCTNPQNLLPRSFFVSRDANSLTYGMEDGVNSWRIRIRSSSCLIEQFSLEQRGQTDGRFKKIVEIQENFNVIETSNNPPLKKKLIFDRGAKTPVGIIDSGIDYNNPYLQSKLVSTDTNGFPYLALDLAENDNLPYDFYVPPMRVSKRGFDFRLQHHHGSHVAGIAVQNSPELAIIPVRMIEGADGYIPERINQFATAITFLKNNGVKCVNMSFGTEDKEEAGVMEKVISNNPDILFITASGNEGEDLQTSPQFPASFQANNLITVASIDKDNSLSDFSNYNNNLVHIGARGSEILSEWPESEPVKMSGTSMAAPQVTRVCGKLHARFPQWSALQIKERILETAKQFNHLSDFIKDGRVLDERKALE